jgi:ribonuclease D
LQIASKENCFLFRLNHTGFTPSLIRLLENRELTKIGLSLRDDFMLLHKLAAFTPQACIDLQNYVSSFGIKEQSLQKIYAILFRKKISKTQRLSNWESGVLTDAQKLYAATDAWACLHIYNLLLQYDPNELSQTVS